MPKPYRIPNRKQAPASPAPPRRDVAPPTLSSPGAGGGAAGSRGAMEAAGLCGMGGFRARVGGDAARVHGTAAGEQELARHPMKGT